MQPRGRAGHGLTCDATNIEERGQVPRLLGSKVNCGKQKHVFRPGGSGQTSWRATAGSVPADTWSSITFRGRSGAHGEVTGQGHKRVCSSLGPDALSSPQSCRMALTSRKSPSMKALGFEDPVPLGVQLLSLSLSLSSPIPALPLTEQLVPIEACHLHLRSLLINRARKEACGKMGTSGPRPRPRIRKRDAQKLDL